MDEARVMSTTSGQGVTPSSASRAAFSWDSAPPSRRAAPARADRRTWTMVVAGIAVLVLFLGALKALFARTDPPAHKAVVQIALVAPPPPPPPPPKPRDEPPKPKDEVKVDQPKPTPQEPQPTPQAPPPGPIGLDSQGSGPGDAFGLAGRPGGRDIIAGSGGGGLGYGLFGSNAARQIAQELARDPQLKSSAYRVELRIWIGKDGRIERGEIEHGSGDQDLDDRIRAGLRQIGTLHLAVPDKLPQPLRIRVTSTDA